MDEIWEKAVETALGGETEPETTRVLTLDGAVKCAKGLLPRPGILEKYPNLEHLSIAGVGVSSLDRFPRLGKLQKLVLSDNRISGGLEFLVRAGLGSLRDLDLSNNRIGLFEDLLPLAELELVSLDLYKCPVTKMRDYRARVFGLVKSLKYLDKMDAEENEIPDGCGGADEEESGADDDDGDDGEERPDVMSNRHGEGVVEGDEEESGADDDEGDDPEIDADGEVTVTGRQSNELRDEHLNMDEEDDDDDSDEEDEYEQEDGLIVDDTNEIEEEVSEGEEEMEHRVSGLVANGAQNVLMNIDEEENDESGEEDEYEPDGLLVDDTHEIEEEDGVEEMDLGVQHGNELLRNILVGEIEHEQEEDDDDESWEEEEEEEEEEEHGTGGRAQSMAEAVQVDEEDSDDEVQALYSIASSNLKRKRDEDDDGDSVSNSDDDNASDDEDE
ncbi:BnaC01g40690D [Brassica napus]|uniref:BnaC01g40690D protein n=1 Tax=Brassica napus TaxID=3708 RepID=A0A078JE36_BRANA|nr:BnaC01g40690D [Brassica napus]